MVSRGRLQILPVQTRARTAVAYQGYDAYNIVLMDADRRREPRVAFGGVAEVSAAGLPEQTIGAVSKLSRLGCFVRFTASLPERSRLTLRITYDGQELTAPGVVIYAVRGVGIGVNFGLIAPDDKAVLDHWLSEAAPKAET